MMPEDRKELYKLLEQRTRAEIMARHCPFFNFGLWGQAYYDIQETDNKIRDLMYGTHDLVELGHRWDLPIDPPAEKEKERRESLKEKGKEQAKPKGLNDERDERRPGEVRRKPLL
jgi:hypothetical protein